MAFPRFTFKKSGADVSASVVFLEKRNTSFTSPPHMEEYSFFVGNIESVGWRAGDKTFQPIYLRDQTNGDLILDEENEKILDADFSAVTKQFLLSPAADSFEWALIDKDIPAEHQTDSISINEVTRTSSLTLDPKRYSGKFRNLQREIRAKKNFAIGDVLEIAASSRFKAKSEALYKYVEIENISVGDYDFNELRGWELPSRARLQADAGDIFIPHIWGCAGKWFIAAGDCKSLVVTNGCARLKVKDGQEALLPYLVIGLSSEMFAVQMRALATGSDGLAEISDDDLLSIILPRTLSMAEKKLVEVQLAPLLEGKDRFSKFAKGLLANGKGLPVIPPRKSHCALV